MPVRDYTYYDHTLSLCPSCLKRIDAKIVFQDNAVYMLKRCPEHGKSKVLIADDIAYYKNIRNYNKPSEYPYKFNTKTMYGCPYDCGLCPDHEQHSCLSIVELTDRCNLTCPTCYAGSSPHYGSHRSLEDIKKMLDVIVANEKEPDVVQLSGGEPTIHPQFFEILEYAKSLPIRHLMLNTNGVRIAKDKGFAEKLATFMPDFEIYLQFDSFKGEVLKELRGEDLTAIRSKAIERLNALNLSTTLVVVVQKGLNDDEIGEIIDYATKQKCVRGVTFQPTQIAGRLDNFNPDLHRITLTEVRRKILEQSPSFVSDDLIPVPCNPDALVMGYALKSENGLIPLTRYINPADLLDAGKNTIVYEQDTELHLKMVELFSTGISVEKSSEKLKSIMCCLPKIDAPEMGYDSLFRIIIMQFMDAHNFDVRAVKKSCVHIVNKDFKIIPFETMNLLYRDEKSLLLEKLKKESV
ncbi:MAG: radical SAM protein [Flavobacteriaceae bacterium]|nr:MAG: radical SAM protein [Flavobacteriaceae bacterium]